MKVQLHLKGHVELAAALNAVSLSVRRKALYGALKAAAEPMRSRMAAHAQRFRRAPAPDLADNIVIATERRVGSVAGGKWQAVDEFQAAVAVGPTPRHFYGHYLEYGTVRASALPFMRPGFDEARDPALGVLRDELWKLMEKAAAREGPFKNLPGESE